MALAGSRFDPEVMRREAEEARERAKQKKIISIVINLAVLVGVGIAALVGWHYWQDYSAEKERQAQEQQAREEKAKADAAREKAAREKAAREKREAELAKQKAERERREAERQRQIREREELRIKQQQEQLRLNQEREEARRREEAARIETNARKVFVDKTMEDLPLDPLDHLIVRKGVEDRLTVAVDDKLWNDLVEAVKDRSALDFFELVRGTTVTNDFAANSYPDRETFARMMKYLNSRTFHLIIRPRESVADIQGLTLVGADPKKGLAVPPKARELKNASGRRTGWTVPFTFGDEPDLFLMESVAVAPFVREWKKIRYRAKEEELAQELKNFVQSVKMELSHPMPVEKSEEKETKRETKPRTTLKGGLGSSIRSFK